MPSRNICFLICAFAFLVAPAFGQIQGRVTDANGAGLPGVKVIYDLVQTDEDGRFTLDSKLTEPNEVARFSKDGYLPVTKSFADLLANPEVRMKQDPEGLWKAPQCAVTRRSSITTGDAMQFLVPKGLQVRKGGDIDYSTNRVCRKKDCLQHSWGPLWSAGMPPFPAKYLAGLHEVLERDILNPRTPNFRGMEYRGIREDGTYTRWVGILGETIAYDGASKESAQLFDALIDSLCWIERKTK